jgi:hypothetical protein
MLRHDRCYRTRNEPEQPAAFDFWLAWLRGAHADKENPKGFETLRVFFIKVTGT